MHLRYSLAPIAMSALFAAPAIAAGLSVNIEIPRLNVSEYHRPYVATWIERADSTMAGTLAVWYDVRTKTNNPEGEGTKWLKDMRQWWRRSGRELAEPEEGVAGASKPAGKHQLSFTGGSGAMPKLAPGANKLVVEAAREVGGREVVTIPFQWPPTAAAQPVAAGKEELGEIKLELKP